MSYILLVEDNPENAAMTIRILESAGYAVKHVTHALESAKVARAERPMVILMDIDLPDLNGRTMTLLLKKQLGGLLSPPIIAVTARTEPDEMRLARNVGCAAFVGKPFDPEQLLKTIERVLHP
jgi:two-component system cell cycle response regulator DivK